VERFELEHCSIFVVALEAQKKGVTLIRLRLNGNLK
jgi:hypothetical protein